MYLLSTPVTGDSEEVVRQRERYVAAIGSETSIAVIQDILQFAEDAQLPEFYKRNKAEDVWYEMLEKSGLEAKVGAIADTWTEVESNVERAIKHVGRQPNDSTKPKVTDFGFCRFKATASTDSWYLLEGGPGTDDEKEQTIVFVALSDLGPNNGFPILLARGQDVCMDGKGSIWTPPTGGGLALFFSLDL